MQRGRHHGEEFWDAQRERRGLSVLMVETNVFLDEVVVMVTDFLEHDGFALLAPAGTRFRLAENGSSGVEVVVRLEDPGIVS